MVDQRSEIAEADQRNRGRRPSKNVGNTDGNWGTGYRLDYFGQNPHYLTTLAQLCNIRVLSRTNRLNLTTSAQSHFSDYFSEGSG